MYELDELIYYLRNFDIDETTIKKCYDLIPNPENKVDTRDKLYIKCDTQYDINTIGSIIENITQGIEKGYIVEAIKKTSNQFSYVRKLPRLVFYIVVLSKIINKK